MLKTFSNYNVLLYTFFWLSVGFTVWSLSLDSFYSTGIYIFFLITILILFLFFVIGVAGLIGLIRQYFDKAYKNPKSKHRVLVPIVAFLWFGIANFLIIPIDTPLKFDAELWHNLPIHHVETKRERMIEDLTKNYLQGKRQENVISLLGKPVESYKFPLKKNELVYVLKVDQEFMDQSTTWLIIRFNETGIYQSHEVVTSFT